MNDRFRRINSAGQVVTDPTDLVKLNAGRKDLDTEHKQ
jgi:hypothetical protein